MGKTMIMEEFHLVTIRPISTRILARPERRSLSFSYRASK